MKKQEKTINGRTCVSALPQEEKALARLPASDVAAGRARELKTEESGMLHRTICMDIGRFIRNMEQWGDDSVMLVNSARGIGLLLRKEWDELPGGQMTIDLWQQWQDRYIGPGGLKYSLEQLKYFVRISTQIPKDITSPREALSWRQDLFGASGFELVGQAPGSNAKPPVNHWSELRGALKKLPGQFDAHLAALAEDPDFGKLSTWAPERRELLRVELQPVIDQLLPLARAVGIKVVEMENAE